MKKLIALTLATLSFSSFAALNDTLVIKGNVPSRVSISVTAESIASNLPLSTTQELTKVATVNERSNSNRGYKVTISSANNGVMVRSGGSETFAYTLTYAGVDLTLSSAVEQDHPSAAAVNTDKDVEISYIGKPAEEMVEGEYSDTITFAIASN